MSGSREFWERAFATLDPVTQGLPPSVFAAGLQEPQLWLQMLPPGAWILDFGCGTGRNALDLLARGFDLTVSDIADSALDFCRATAGSRGYAVKVLPVTAAGRLSSPANAFDAILAWSVLDHVSHTAGREVMRELARVAKDGALLLGSFDGPEELDEPHRVFPDGSVEVTDGRRTGLIVRFYSDQEVQSLCQPEWEILHYSGGADRRKVVVCRRRARPACEVNAHR